MYFFAVSRWIPTSLATPESTAPRASPSAQSRPSSRLQLLSRLLYHPAPHHFHLPDVALRRRRTFPAFLTQDNSNSVK